MFDWRTKFAKDPHLPDVSKGNPNKIDYASARENDFSGAHDYYDLWVFDEFHEPEQSNYTYTLTEAGNAYHNTLLKILDGQECRLDSKYNKVFKRKCA